MLRSHKLTKSAPLDSCFDLPVHVYLKSKAGIYLECNTPQAKSFGANKGSDIVGYKDIDYLEEDQSYALKINDAKIISSETASILIEKVLFPGLQPHKTFLSYKTPARNKSGKVIGAFGISFPMDKEALSSINHSRFHFPDIINYYGKMSHGNFQNV